MNWHRLPEFATLEEHRKHNAAVWRSISGRYVASSGRIARLDKEWEGQIPFPIFEAWAKRHGIKVQVV